MTMGSTPGPAAPEGQSALPPGNPPALPPGGPASVSPGGPAAALPSEALPSEALPSEALPSQGCPLTAGQFTEQEAILAEMIGEDPGEPAPAARAVLSWPDVSDHGPGGPEGPSGPGGPGFASGSALDTLPPGPVLAAALDDTFAAGLGRLPDDELAGVILAARRCESRATGQLLAAVGELDRRRQASGDRRQVERSSRWTTSASRPRA